MPTSSRVQLVVDDFGGDAPALSALLGLEPTAVGVAEGSAAGKSNQGTSWIFDISMPETESIEGQALALLRFLDAHAEEIRRATARYSASIAIAVEDSGDPDPSEMSLVPLVAADIS